MAILSEPGLQLQPYQIVLRPLVTEKGTHQSEKHNTYTFEVHPFATKIQIRDAVQELWKVKVLSVRTQTRVGKPRRTKTGETQTAPWKRAIVKLHDDDRISFY